MELTVLTISITKYNMKNSKDCEEFSLSNWKIFQQKYYWYILPVAYPKMG